MKTGTDIINDYPRSRLCHYCSAGEETNDDVDLIMSAYCGSDNQKWSISLTHNGSYKIKAKSSENYTAKDLVMDLQYVLLQNNGLNLRQKEYLDNTSYKDEWYLIDIHNIFGNKSHRSLTSSQRSNINCHGYAMFINEWPWDVNYDSYGIWWHRTLSYLANITTITDTVKQNISSKSQSDFEEWLNENDYAWTYEPSFSGNGENNILDSNQYRVVLRTGIQYICGTIICDYHFWYQTSDGTWSNKHGKEIEIHLPSGTTPFSSGSSGWSLDYMIENVEYTFTNFYDGTIYSYIITVD